MRYIFLFLLLIVLASAGAQAGLTCDCVDKSPAESLKVADSVFIGTVVRVNRVLSETTFTFEVTQTLKGTHSGMVEVIDEGSDCDKVFNLGGTYIVYAVDSEGRLTAPSCLSSAPVMKPRGPTIDNGTGFTVQRISQGPGKEPRFGLIAALVVSISLVIGILVGYFRRRRT